MNKESKNKTKAEDRKAADVLTEATQYYFEMLNKSISACNSHRTSNKKELKRGARTTEHRITL